LDRNGTFEFGLLVQGVHNPLGDWLVTAPAQSGAGSSAAVADVPYGSFASAEMAAYLI
jgi:hypothetical protein